MCFYFFYVNNHAFTRKSLYYDGVATFTPGPDLPNFIFGVVCLQNLNDEETLIVYRSAFIYNHNSNTFTRMSSQPGSGSDWEASSCGVTRDANGNAQYVVIGGGRYMEDHVQILDIAARTWSVGPSLPSHLKATVAVPYKRSFLLVGGRSNEAFTDEVLEFDSENMRWISRPERMPGATSHHFAAWISDEDANC